MLKYINECLVKDSKTSEATFKSWLLSLKSQSTNPNVFKQLPKEKQENFVSGKKESFFAKEKEATSHKISLIQGKDSLSKEAKYNQMIY